MPSAKVYPHANVYPVYSQQIGALAATSASIDIANRLAAPLPGPVRPWQLPPSPALWNQNPLDVQSPSHHSRISQGAFTRKEMENAYPYFHLKPYGSVGDAAATKLQADTLGSMERAWHLKELTPVRACMHMAGRRGGHGHPSGIWIRQINYIADLIIAGSTKFRPQ